MCAQTHPDPPPTQIDAAAGKYFECELSDTATTKLVDATATQGEPVPSWLTEWGTACGGVYYHPQVLSHRGMTEFMVTALVVLRFELGHTPRSVGDLAAQLSHVIANHGDLPARALLS